MTSVGGVVRGLHACVGDCVFVRGRVSAESQAETKRNGGGDGGGGGGGRVLIPHCYCPIMMQSTAMRHLKQLTGLTATGWTETGSITPARLPVVVVVRQVFEQQLAVDGSLPAPGVGRAVKLML